MSGSLCLNGTWGLTWVEGTGRMDHRHYTAASLCGHRMMEVPVPAPIHRVLMDRGLIDDLNIGLNSFKARWVEEQFWIYRHAFVAPAEALDQHACLVFEKLEHEAVLWLNGETLGTHANAHRPARFDVSGKLRSGENLLVLRLTTGMHSAAEKPVVEYEAQDIDRLTRRPWQRKPQYQCGWDWHPRLMNVGILGDVRLEWCRGPRLDQVAVFAVPDETLSAATVHVRAFVQHAGDSAVEGTLRARIVETGEGAEVPVRIGPGESRHELRLVLAEPRLWWPTGHGEQFRYTVHAELAVGAQTQSVTRRTGVRRVEIDQSPHPVEGRYFILRINNRPVFCKGANWVPPDMLYSTVEQDRYRRLITLAVEANFNMLRVWGGGCFAHQEFYESCDQAGVLVWHDFMFACAKYPGDDPAFAAEVRREATFALRDLGHHPCIVVWCGSNEIEWADWNWGYDRRYRAHPHYAMFHHDLPKIALEEAPATAYWISSPSSPDYKEPNDPTVGDQHPWAIAMGDPSGVDFWRCRDGIDRFPNEGGAIGVSSPATLRQFLPDSERYLCSPSWQHHDNPFACTSSRHGELGRAYATVELWTGRHPEEMHWEQYAFISALLQAEGLQEFIANYRRRMFSSAAAVFWMYNDSWPVTHGWTIVDYYLRRKLAYHPVRRAFQPVTVAVVAEGDEVVVFGVNDTLDPVSGELRYGLFDVAGGLPLDQRAQVTLPPNASTPLARFDRSGWAKRGYHKSGAFAVLSANGRLVAQHRLLLARFKDLALVEPRIEVRLKDGRLTLTSDAFAWGVCLDVDGDQPLPDNCFDLLPGIPYPLPWPTELAQPAVVRLGNRDAVGRGPTD